MKYTLYFIVLLTISSCTYQNKYSLKDYSVIGSADKGAILVSIKYSNYGYSQPSTSFSIRRKNGKYVTNLSKHSASTISFNNDGNGFVELLELPKGEYEVYRWGLFYNHGQFGSWNEYQLYTSSIPFTVKPGVINYLGEISLEDYKYTFRNKKDRDLPIILKEMPDLSKATLVIHTLECISRCYSPEKRVVQ